MIGNDLDCPNAVTEWRDTAVRLRCQALLPAMLLAVFSLTWSAALVMWPRPSEPVAALFPPWVSADRALAETASAGNSAIWGKGGWATVIIAQSDDPDFAGRLLRSGAVMVVRAPKVAGCVL